MSYLEKLLEELKRKHKSEIIQAERAVKQAADCMQRGWPKAAEFQMGVAKSQKERAAENWREITDLEAFLRFRGMRKAA
jgi:hypothetical protein